MKVWTDLLALVGLMAGLFLVGCALADSEAANIGPSGQACATASECGGGFVCMDFTCVPRGPDAPDYVSVELRPSDSSGYARTQLLDVDLVELANRNTLELPAPTEYETMVIDAEANAISADLAIFGTPRIPGREVDVSATVVAGGTSPVFRLLEGSYVVRIRPTSNERPGMEVTGFTVRAQPGRLTKQFELPTTYRRLYGEVTSSLSNSEKLAGFEVRAFGEKSGLPSTVSITGEDGSYELLLPASEDTTFRLVATPPDDAQPAWGFEQVVGGIDDVDGRERQLQIEPTRAEMQGAARVQILGTTLDGRLDAPVANAYVTLTATVTGVLEPPAFRVSGITDADGFMVVDVDDVPTTQVPLLRARYVATVVPPINTAYTSQQSLLDLNEAQGGFVIEAQVILPQRTQVRGAVVSALGNPVDNALVEVRPLDANNRPGDAITALDGTFAVSLDPGPYILVVQPRVAGLGEELVPVAAQRIDVPQQQAIDLPTIVTPHGQRVALSVVGAEREPVANTRVEVFVQLEGEAISLGRTETEPSGKFELVLPRPTR